MNKEMIERRANQVPKGAEEQTTDIQHSLFGLFCSDVYDKGNPDKLLENHVMLGFEVSELGAIRLRGIDSFDLFEQQALANDLNGLLIGYTDESWPLHVRRERPYLFTPVRALAALETLLTLWGDEGKAFWSEGVSYCIRYLCNISANQNPTLANLTAWTRSENPGSAAKGLLYLHTADAFEAALKEGLVLPEKVLQDSLWFLEAADFENILRDIESIRRRIISDEMASQDVGKGIVG
jgi:hypothetical protein